jgi:hypothetical protein
MRQLTAVIVGCLALTAISLPALAGVCIALDEDQDNLAPADRSGALIILRQTLMREGAEVVSDGCERTYTVYNVQIGRSVTAFLSDGERTLDARAETIEELPDVYSQLVRALVHGTTLDAAVTRDNVTAAQDAPRRQQADSMGYGRIGFGGIVADGVRPAIALGGGYRLELDHVFIDASIGALVLTGDEQDAGGANLTGRLGAGYFFDGLSDSTPYLGAALTYGVIGVCINEEVCYVDDGLGADVIAGYEFLRSSTIRLFFEANASFPFFDTDLDSGGDGASAALYTPSLSISFGLGFGRAASSPLRVY